MVIPSCFCLFLRDNHKNNRKMNQNLRLNDKSKIEELLHSIKISITLRVIYPNLPLNTRNL